MVESLLCVLQKKRHKERKERHRDDDDRKHRQQEQKVRELHLGVRVTIQPLIKAH